MKKKFLCVIWDRVAKISEKFVTLRSFLKIKKKFKPKKIEKFHMDSEKSINSYGIKKG